MKKFNAKLGRRVVFNMYPFGMFVIEAINADGTLDLAMGDWKIYGVPQKDVMRDERFDPYYPYGRN